MGRRNLINTYKLDIDDLGLNTRNNYMKEDKKKTNCHIFLETYFQDTEEKYKNDTTFLEKADGYALIAWSILNAKHNRIPSEFYSDHIYSMELLKFLKSEGELIAKKAYYNESHSECEFYYLYSYNKMMVFFVCGFSEKYVDGYINSLGVQYIVGVSDKINVFDKFIFKVKDTPQIGIIKTTKYGPTVSFIDHKTDYTFAANNYNEDFMGFYDDLKLKLKENKTGLYLFYGEAGTGKSSAIRQLISDVDRQVVFVPPQMINSLSNPDFTDLVLNSLKGSILVIEDAEKALMKRETEDGFHNSELVSSLLNLTDGLYADLAHTSIIATYNCDRNLIDPALLRKGRLRSEYHFQKLSIDRSQKLMDSLGHKVDVTETMTLADIFNYEKQYTNKKVEKKRAVGFGG